ncbi:MAG: MarR family winged helix-turn-helix transcriptional regulator, partial [Thermoanaerobaculia bacterium]
MTSRLALQRPASIPASDIEATRLRLLIQTFIRSSGLLAGDQTPCGHPVAVSHAHALMVLLETARKARPVTQRELGQALGIDKSNVARLCRRMESAGHLVQSRSKDDGRARLLAL